MRRGDVRILALALAGLAAGTACYPGEINDISEADLSLAIRNPTVPEGAFQLFQTYAMFDTVVQIYPDTNDPSPPTVTRAYDQLILDQVESHLNARGYIRIPVDTANPPDMLVMVSVVAQTYTGASVWYPWYWWGSWGWGWYPCCYYYPPMVTYYQWDQGTIHVSIADPVPDSANAQVKVYWLGAVSGVLDVSSGAGTTQRIETGIDRIFDISPYLRRN